MKKIANYCFSLYAPVKHAHGTTESTKADAIA